VPGVILAFHPEDLTRAPRSLSHGAKISQMMAPETTDGEWQQ
jgi:hypothetical protein